VFLEIHKYLVNCSSLTNGWYHVIQLDLSDLRALFSCITLRLRDTF